MTEREKFEAFWRREMNVELMDLHRCQFPMTEDADQPYACHETQRGWLAWQASRRAALEEAANACLVAEPDTPTRKALGDAAHYVACAAAIRALAGTET